MNMLVSLLFFKLSVLNCRPKILSFFSSKAMGAQLNLNWNVEQEEKGSDHH